MCYSCFTQFTHVCFTKFTNVLLSLLVSFQPLPGQLGEVGGRSSISSLPRLSARWPLRVRGRAHVSGDYPRDGGATRLSQTQGGDTQPTAVHIVAHMCSPWLQHTQQIWHHGNATVRAQLWALDAANGHAAVAWLPPLPSDDASGGAAATVAAVEKATGRILVK